MRALGRDEGEYLALFGCVFRGEQSRRLTSGVFFIESNIRGKGYG